MASSSASVEARRQKHGPLRAFTGSHPSCSYRPTRQHRAAAHYALNGPMRAHFQLAHTRVYMKFDTGCCWPTQSHRSELIQEKCGPLRAFPGSHPSCLCRPTRQHRAAGYFALNGPTRAHCQLAHTRHFIRAAVGRLEPVGRGSSLKGWAAASISREPSQLPI